MQASEAEQSVEEKVGLRRDARQTALEAKQDDLAALQRLEAERDRIEELIRRLRE